jgi:Transposase DDE domain/Transposase domain (DUF772)
MTLGRRPADRSLFRSSAELVKDKLDERSIFALLAREGDRIFPDEMFADLFKDIGRRSVSPRIVVTVMVLQRFEGLSDREAVDRFTFDMRWKFAAGALDLDHPSFVHTVLVDMRERLRRSERPNRVFEVVLEIAKQCGVVGRKRVLDSTALYDAVATQDTVTMVRSGIRGVLRAADETLARELRGVLKRDDDYVSAGKPTCDWDDTEARERLVDALARDAFAVLAQLDNRALQPAVTEAAKLLATVAGQDIEETDGLFRIANRVAKDRTISTVDPEARHGHKTESRGFDGFKGHIAIDPDSEIVTATSVTPGNVGDADAAKDLLDEALAAAVPSTEPITVYGDASYGSADLVEHVEKSGAVPMMKVQAAPAKAGMYSQADFKIDIGAATVTCPAGNLVQLHPMKEGYRAHFGVRCGVCPLRSHCTTSKEGRLINVHAKHETLARMRAKQKDPAFAKAYKATRPKVERKIAHMMRRRHGGRRARMRGRLRIGHDFALLAASVNLSRIATIGCCIPNHTATAQ